MSLKDLFLTTILSAFILALIGVPLWAIWTVNGVFTIGWSYQRYRRNKAHRRFARHIANLIDKRHAENRNA